MEGGGGLLFVAAGEVAFDRDGELGEPSVALDFAESGLGLEHPGGGPAQAHLSGAPVLDVAVDCPDGGDHRLARVGRLQRPFELAGDSQPGDGQRLLHALSEGSGGARVGAVEVERQRGELLERDGVVIVLPRLAELSLDCVAVAFGEVVENVSFFVTVMPTSA